MTGTPKIAAAREVASFLDSIGEHKRANDIRALCRSNSALIETASRLRRDLDAARTSAPSPSEASAES